MAGISAWMVALIVAAVALAGTTWWFGVHRRRQEELKAGVAALANMKWRESVGLVLQAMAREGYVEEPSSRQPGDGGSEFLLRRGDKLNLLSYKHGTAYRLGEANVRDFANGVQLQGAHNGILVTLGSAESFARDLARRYGVELIDGDELWPKVRSFMPHSLMEGIQAKAAGQTRQGLWLGVGASFLLGAIAFVLGPALDEAPASPGPEGAAASTAALPVQPPAPAEAEASATGDPVDPGTPSLGQPQTAAQQVAAAQRAMAEIAALTEQDKAERRREAAARVAQIASIENAAWSTNSTLVLRLIRSDGEDGDLVAEVCRSLVQFEELRFTRLQLELAGAAEGRVRWRQCQ